MNKVLDTIAGGLLGALTGAVCCGVLMMIWFSMPISRQPQFEVSDTDMFYKPQDYALEAATIVADRDQGRPDVLRRAFPARPALRAAAGADAGRRLLHQFGPDRSQGVH